LDEKVDFLAAHLSSGVGETHGNVSLNLLAKDLPEGLSILRAVLTEPRFQENKLTLEKAQILSSIKQRNDDSSDIEAREVNYLGFGDKFFVNRHVTAASLDALKSSDLREFHRRWFFPSNFILAVSGDFDREQMKETLEKFFDGWPIPKGEPAPPVPSDPTFGAPGTYIINKDVNQGRVSIFLPGIKRDDPEYFDALVMNDILGGGGFTSHLMNRIRSDEGLAYSVFSRLDGGVYFPQLFRTGFQSKSRTVPYAISIVLDELKTMTEKKVTAEELENSKRGFIERLPRYFATKTQVANLFAQDELTGRYKRDPNFWQEYRERVQKVNADEVQNIAQRLVVDHKPIILIVGNKDDILKGHPKYDVDLAKKFGPIKELPMRDPLTLKLGSLP
jgi:zinc protease